ncbi:hypothetical protein MRB53_038855 [Persea americana]|nr:hypothetical protein MRB53_038855 [Persea americana]
MDDLIATVENNKQVYLYLRVEGKSIAEQVQHLDDHFRILQEPVDEAADYVSQHGIKTCQDNQECIGEVDRLKQRIEELEEQNKNWSDNLQELIQHKNTVRHKNSELEILNEETQYFKQKLADLRSELIDLKLDNTRLQEEVKDLKNKDWEQPDCGW